MTAQSDCQDNSTFSGKYSIQIKQVHETGETLRKVYLSPASHIASPATHCRAGASRQNLILNIRLDNPIANPA